MSRHLSILIEEELRRQIEERFGAFPSIRSQIQLQKCSLLTEIAEFVDNQFHAAADRTAQHYRIDPMLLRRALRDKRFVSRVKQVVLQFALTEPLCSQLRIIPAEVPDTDESSGLYKFPVPLLPTHAIVVEQLGFVTNEVFPLMVDSYVHDLGSHRRVYRNVCCAHVEWLDDDFQATRGIFYRPDQDELIEKDFSNPLPLHSVHFLCLSQTTHHIYSERADEKHLFQVNPYPESAQADNKFFCYQKWKAAGVSTPEAALIQQNAEIEEDLLTTEIRHALNTILQLDISPDSHRFFLQPNHGTEARGVRAFTLSLAPDISLPPELLLHARSILEYDDLLIRPEVGNVLFCENAQEPGTHFDIRLNVVHGKVESGYLMLAKPGEIITAPGQHGRVLELRDADEWTLRSGDKDLRLKIGSSSWQKIEETAEQAAAAFPNILMTGVDIRLDWTPDRQQWTSWILDLNPRPAGLTHSRLLNTVEPGVTLRLWHKLDTIQGEPAG